MQLYFISKIACPQENGLKQEYSHKKKSKKLSNTTPDSSTTQSRIDNTLNKTYQSIENKKKHYKNTIIAINSLETTICG